jgi:Tol biopolymer transport system component
MFLFIVVYDCFIYLVIKLLITQHNFIKKLIEHKGGEKLKKVVIFLLITFTILMITCGAVSAAEGDTIEITANGNSDSNSASISEDGNWVAYRSFATNLVVGDSVDSHEDIYLYNTQNGVNIKVTPLSGSNGDSENPSISGDGTWITYNSMANNLVAGDDIDTDMDIFLYNRQTLITSKVNPLNSEGWNPSISGDGNWITYVSSSHIAGDSDAFADIFLYNRVTGVTTKVTPTSNGNSFGYPTISGDGTWITYSSVASNIVVGDTNDAVEDIFLFNRLTGVTSKVTPLSGSNGDSSLPKISSEGNWIAYGSVANNIVAGDINDAIVDIFLFNRLTGVTSKITPFSGSNFHSENPVISNDGIWVAYASYATNLVAGDTSDTFMDIFLYNRLTGVTIKVSPLDPNGNSGGPSISGDGNWITYSSMANIAAGDKDSFADIYLYNNPLVNDPNSSTNSGNNQSTVNAVMSAETRNTIGMQNTGAPLAPLALAILSLMGFFASKRRK